MVVSKLTGIKITHTIIWVFFNVVIFYLAYAVMIDQIDALFWVGVGIIALEVMVLLLYKWRCPLTVIARRYSDSSQDNFDIYLPNWLAKYNKLIYTIICIGIACMLIYKKLMT